MSSRELLLILRRLIDLDIVGADIVEVAPAYDHAEITAIAAANIVYELICLFGQARSSSTATEAAGEGAN